MQGGDEFVGDLVCHGPRRSFQSRFILYKDTLFVVTQTTQLRLQ